MSRDALVVGINTYNFLQFVRNCPACNRLLGTQNVLLNG